MRYIGLRCWPDRFAYVVLEGTVGAPILIASDTVTIPADDDRPSFLNWISKEVRTILKRYPQSRCSYKAIEPMAFKNSDSLRRSQAEGVVQAVAHESGHRDCKLHKTANKGAHRIRGRQSEETRHVQPVRAGTDSGTGVRSVQKLSRIYAPLTPSTLL
jgi:Holliday junction resolvasome RuvABC endonuclease subunit